MRNQSMGPLHMRPCRVDLGRRVRSDDPRRRRRRERGEPAERGGERGSERQAGQDRRVRQPRQRAHDEAHPSEREVDEGPHESRIELRARAARDLRPSFRRVAGLLVRARRGDDVEDVGDRHDASGERDLLAGDPTRVALAVPTLVVVADRFDPFAEPLAQRRDHLLSEQRMLPQLVPFLVGRLAGLVENLGPDLELPDVVQERRPVQMVEVIAMQAELPPEAVGVSTDALGVATRQGIVRVESGDELQQNFGRFLCGRRLARPAQSLSEALDSACAQRDLEPRRRLVGKDERQAEQRAEREQPLGQRVAERHDNSCEGADPEPPREEGPERARGHAGQRRHELHEADRSGNRQAVDEQPDGARTPGVRRPATHVRLTRRSHSDCYRRGEPYSDITRAGQARRTTWSAVPRPGTETSRKPPPIEAARARMFFRPCPAAISDSSKPAPSSTTLTKRSPARSSIRTSARRAPACLRAFASPSWTMRKTSICSSGASRIPSWISSSTSRAPSAVRKSTYRRRAASKGAEPPADERASTAKRASCCAASAASFSCGSVVSGEAPFSSMLACVETANRYCASPSWISRATRARSSATARPNSANRIARQTPTRSTL